MYLVDPRISSDPHDLIPLCRLFMRPLQLHFMKFFSPRRDIPSRPVPLSPQVKSLCLLWGSQEFLLQGKSFSPPPHLLISSDASNLGWGAFLHPYHVSAVWSPQESRLHINSLELLAVFLALQSFEDLIFGQSILIRSDNSTVVSYINRQGGTGTHSPSLCNLTLDLWDWCRERGIHLSASHVPGEDNLLADFLSRAKEVPAFRVDSESLGVSEDLSCLPSSGDRLVRFGPDLPASQVLLEGSGPPSLGYRREVVPVVGSTSFRVPPVQSAPSSTSESSSGRSRPPSHSPSLASETLVSSPSVATGGLSEEPSASPGPSSSAYLPLPSSGSSASFTLAAFRKRGQEAGLTERAADFAAQSLRPSTRCSYDARTGRLS